MRYRAVSSFLLFLAFTCTYARPASPATIFEGRFRHLVVLKPDASLSDVYTHETYLQGRGVPVSWFSFPEDGKIVRGYSALLNDMEVDLLAEQVHVEYVEEDATVFASSEQYQYQYQYPLDNNVDTMKSQRGAPWGLERISHRSLSEHDHDHMYHYLPKDGEHVTVYVVDTGIYVQHEEFQGRASWGVTTASEDDENVDGNGHGTHCAGTIAGKTYGVCKHCKVVAVKVLSRNGSGSMSDVIRGIEYVIDDHRKRAEKATEGKPGNSAKSVANLSLGGSYTRTLNRAVNAASKAGIHFVVAAGNEHQDACNTSPASAESAISVGATDSGDAMTYFSNYGKCTTLYAPGYEIESAWIGSPRAKLTISGTSMAAPHVAGTVGALLSRDSTRVTNSDDLKSLLVEMATHDAISGIPRGSGGVNALLYTGVVKKKLSKDTM